MLNRYKIINLSGAGIKPNAHGDEEDPILRALFEQNEHLMCVEVDGWAALRMGDPNGKPNPHAKGFLRYYEWRLKQTPKDSKLKVV